MTNLKRTLKNKKGFTLIELIVVIAILSILSSILIPSVTGYIDAAKNARDMANSRAIYTEYALADATNNDAYVLDSHCSADSGISSFECTWDSGITYSVANNFVGE